MKVGYIGVGNMGGPMCRNIIKRSNHSVTVFDLNAAAVKTCTDLGAHGRQVDRRGDQGRRHRHDVAAHAARTSRP